MKYLAFDLGLVHTGVAISYEGQLIEGLTTINTTSDQLASKIIRLVSDHQPDQIVLGFPPSGPIADLAQKMQSQLQEKLESPVILFSEHQTTKHSQKLLHQSGLSLVKRRRKDHSTAACLLLQQYLDIL